MNGDELLAKINKVIQPFGCVATELGPYAVAVMGDDRFYGPSVFVTFSIAMNMEEVGKISTKITNEVHGISRVLMNIPT